jgi:hypothetical protein
LDARHEEAAQEYRKYNNKEPQFVVPREEGRRDGENVLYRRIRISSSYRLYRKSKQARHRKKKKGRGAQSPCLRGQ